MIRLSYDKLKEILNDFDKSAYFESRLTEESLTFSNGDVLEIFKEWEDLKEVLK